MSAPKRLPLARQNNSSLLPARRGDTFTRTAGDCTSKNMWLVLCDSADPSGPRAAHQLRWRGLKPLELVTSDALATARLWEHRISTHDTSIEIVLADGRRIHSTEIKGVLNRIVTFPPTQLKQAHKDDLAYAAHELFAFYVSWLNAFRSPVVNRPTSFGLSGAQRTASQWTAMAYCSGLPICTWRVSSRHHGTPAMTPELFEKVQEEVRQIIVLGRAVVPSTIPRDIADGCRRLATSAKVDLLVIQFSTVNIGDDSRWTFSSATTIPNLICGGEELIDALAHLLHYCEDCR